MDESIKLPDLWEGWELDELIGSGSYGDVYQATYHGSDPSVAERTAAIKIIRIPSSNAEAIALAHELPGKEDRIRYYQNIVEGLRSEIRAMEALRDNGHVVALQDHYIAYNGEIPEWTIYLRMELLMPLPEYLITHAPDEDLILRLGIEMCSALEECGKKDILHRDIKPENILVTDDGAFRLGDFGVARQMDLTTATLSLKGTFTYMAPEVYHGEKYGVKADQYSLGIVLYRLLNRNRDPFVDPAARMVYYKDREEALRRRMGGEQLPPPAEASEKLASIVLKACAFSPEDRYDSISDMKHDLMVCAGKLPDGELLAEKGKASSSGKAVTALTPDGTKVVGEKRVKKPLLVGIITVILIGVIAGGIAFSASGLLGSKNGSSEKTSEETSGSSELWASGECGDSLEWTITNEGVLTISGEGMMDSYEILHFSPWRELQVTKDKNIKEVYVEEGVTGIGSYAFWNRMLLAKVKLPESLEYIGDGAFELCSSILQITLGKNVSFIGQKAFGNCFNLRTITVDKDNPVFESPNYCNAVIEKATGTLVLGCYTTTIPEEVTAIGPYAFAGATKLTELYIPDSVESIDGTAFEDCEENLVLCGSEGSAAEKFANSQGIEFRVK